MRKRYVQRVSLRLDERIHTAIEDLAFVGRVSVNTELCRAAEYWTTISPREREKAIGRLRPDPTARQPKRALPVPAET